MGKLPGLVNYSDDEDQSSSDEDVQQQQQSRQSQPPSHQHSVAQSQSQPKPLLQPQPITRPEQQQQQTKSQDSNGTKPQVESSSAQKSATPTQRIKSPLPVPTALIGDRSTQLKTILTPKPLPGVENWGIPPEPQSECDPDRLEQIKHFLSLRQSGHRLNDHLQRNKAFRNPRIYAKLVDFVELNETGSNFPPKEFDPTAFPTSSYIDGILETQKKLADEKAQLQAQGRSQLSFVPPSKSAAPAPSLDANAKFAAAMANAAKIANKIAKPVPQQQQQPLPAPSTTTLPPSSSHDHSDHSSRKRSSSHRQWDRRDDKRRHRY